MNKIRIGIALGLVCVIAFAFTSTRIIAQDNSAREKDRAEIEELMWRYTRALDTGNGEAYAATYTVDGQFGTGANAAGYAVREGFGYRAARSLFMHVSLRFSVSQNELWPAAPASALRKGNRSFRFLQSLNNLIQHRC